MNRLQLRNLAYSLADEEPGAIFSTAAVNRFINLGLQHVSRTVPLNLVDYEVTMTSGQATYELENPVIEGQDIHVESVVLNGRPLASRSLDYTMNRDTTGTPSYWYDTGGKIGLWPVPSDQWDEETLDVQYYKELDELNSDSESPSISSAAQEAGVIYAVYLMKMKDDEHGSADRWNERFRILMRELAGPRSGVYKA